MQSRDTAYVGVLSIMWCYVADCFVNDSDAATIPVRSEWEESAQVPCSDPCCSWWSWWNSGIPCMCNLCVNFVLKDHFAIESHLIHITVQIYLTSCYVTEVLWCGRKYGLIF